MKRHLFVVLLSTILLSSCGDGGTPSPDPKPKIESYTIDFSSIDLGSEKQIFGNQEEFKTKILETINKDLEEPILLDVTTTGENSVKIEKSDFVGEYTNVQGLIVATAKYDGELNLQFARECLSVTIKAEQYYNIYNGGSGTEIHYDGQRYVENPDGEDYYEGYFEIGVNDLDFAGSGETYVYNEDWTLKILLPESETEKFDINSKILTISGYAAVRTRIYEMTFEFEAN